MHVESLDENFDSQTFLNPHVQQKDVYENALQKAGFKLSLEPVVVDRPRPDHEQIIREERPHEDVHDNDLLHDIFFDPFVNDTVLDDEGENPITIPHNDAIDPSIPQPFFLFGNQTTYQSRALGDHDQRTKEYLEHVVQPGLEGVTYDNVYELFYNDLSAGLSWTMEGIGQLSLLWDGQAYLEGDESTVDQTLSLELHLNGALHVSNVVLDTLTVTGADVYVSHNAQIQDFRILKGDNGPAKEVVIEKDATLSLKTLVSDHALSNKGTLDFREEGRLHMNDTLFVNQGTIKGHRTVVMDGAHHIGRQGTGHTDE